MLENKLNRILVGLQKIKHIEDQALTAYQTEQQSQKAIDNYRVHHEELIGLCEEYWGILRNESFMFCSLPERMFTKEPLLVDEIRKTFILQLILVSQCGFLISNDDFIFADNYLARAMSSVAKGFLTFMRCLLSKLTTQMLSTLFWAKKLEDMITAKMRAENSDPNFRMNILRNSPNPSALSGTQAIEQLNRINNYTKQVVLQMFDEIDGMRLDNKETEKYDH